LKRFILYILFNVGAIETVFSQPVDVGSWNILNLKFNYNEQWTAFGETQLRSLKLYDHFHYYEFKGGINYRLQKNVALTIAAGSYQTYKEGGDFYCLKTMQNLGCGRR
jgi:hypothetical protein